MARGKRFVTVYEHHRIFAGHEEGGWYVSRHEATYSKKVSSARTAKREQERLQKWYGRDYIVLLENKKELWSYDSMDTPIPRYE